MKSIKSKKEPFGYHLMVDLYGCNKSQINSLDFCYNFLDTLPTRIGMDKQSPPYIFRSPENYPGKAGLSGWVPIIQSGISIHTLTETQFVSIDVYSCVCFDQDKVIKEIVQYFNPEKIEKNFVQRGKNYYIL
ncbi:MAG TPA: S-adenosylmethionine decarboxylase [Patescibacteria group bacterium]|nr:S-adenosylmethionine decarboxylase [Patescibacteria group bacterium]